MPDPMFFETPEINDLGISILLRAAAGEDGRINAKAARNLVCAADPMEGTRLFKGQLEALITSGLLYRTKTASQKWGWLELTEKGQHHVRILVQFTRTLHPEPA